ncbi:hypothetical protein SBD_0884 [Streptomyces bottropensis ATCC 25435]|uniref:Uncharacterized protein n=1 Tax=Streptomyces bottropensis ATCC 25435 TaxID=1054862 RepID=M3DMQ7_9ACTN|nr:hypothetical protein SBD_0884 [Streptomyces bottropensis ATCC 25435]
MVSCGEMGPVVGEQRPPLSGFAAGRQAGRAVVTTPGRAGPPGSAYV